MSEQFPPAVIEKLGERLKRSLVKEGDCLLTTYSGYQGYAHLGMMFNGRLYRIRAHRLAYLLAKGSIDPALHVCHRCDKPACCNPDHLFEGSARENQLDSMAKGRKPIGENHPQAKTLDRDIVIMGRLREIGLAQHEIAEAFGISQSQVSAILNGERKTIEPIVRDTAEGLLRELVEDHNKRYGTVGDKNYSDLIVRARKLLESQQEAK